MVMSLFRRNYRNAGAKVTVFFHLKDGDGRKRHESMFSLTGLELHNIARKAKDHLRKHLEKEYGRADPRGLAIWNNTRWELFARLILNAIEGRHVRGTLSETDYHALVAENSCALVNEAFDDFTDGELITVSIDTDTNVDVETIQRNPVDFRQRRLGNINERIEREPMQASVNRPTAAPGAGAKPASDLDRYRFQWKDGAAFFEYQCKFGFTDLQEGKGIVALVLDSRKEFGTSVAVKVGPDGRQLATIRVAAEDGGFVVPASTPSSRGDPLQPGDVVVWVPGKYVSEVAKAIGDERSGWVGLIRAKVDLTQPAGQGPLQLVCEYD